jgi:hypothetical protein
VLLLKMVMRLLLFRPLVRDEGMLGGVGHIDAKGGHDEHIIGSNWGLPFLSFPSFFIFIVQWTVRLYAYCHCESRVSILMEVFNVLHHPWNTRSTTLLSQAPSWNARTLVHQRRIPSPMAFWASMLFPNWSPDLHCSTLPHGFSSSSNDKRQFYAALHATNRLTALSYCFHITWLFYKDCIRVPYNSLQTLSPIGVSRLEPLVPMRR